MTTAAAPSMTGSPAATIVPNTASSRKIVSGRLVSSAWWRSSALPAEMSYETAGNPMTYASSMSDERSRRSASRISGIFAFASSSSPLELDQGVRRVLVLADQASQAVL